ncbi:MAG: MotA/TolQ/ExbB proton channel family protein [Bacteroidetes bacterium]|nr:MAG: MotA/TolQ/ExbB proton channel family protein [Bacteroidota bacterium]TAE72598.1 MAG: MotA/TolQ/ExbB proton channel family protein [Bacteroidota bacterium]TAF94257.1 MAG: MotA/TolQ/ExbB proton channel family protein [Bacteroidota bacterium]
MGILLQVVDTASKAAQAVSNTAEQINLWSLLNKGGFLMYPLYALFAAVIFVFVERFMAISKAAKLEANFMSMIRDNIFNGNVSAARTLAKNTDNAVAKMIDKGIQRIGKPLDAIEKSMENVGKLEMYKMEKNLGILSLIAGVAPMFGFLGTIVGMIQLFYNINNSGFELNTIAGGIYVKMVTSASGLIVGLLAYVCHNYLTAQIDKAANKMEAASAEFIDILQEPTR